MPGTAGFVGRPTATTGSATTQGRELIWRLDLARAGAESAGFTVRVPAGGRGGLLVAELSAAGTYSNCPPGTDPGLPGDSACHATVPIAQRAVGTARSAASPEAVPAALSSVNRAPVTHTPTAPVTRAPTPRPAAGASGRPSGAAALAAPAAVPKFQGAPRSR